MEETLDLRNLGVGVSKSVLSGRRPSLRLLGVLIQATLPGVTRDTDLARSV